MYSLVGAIKNRYNKGESTETRGYIHWRWPLSKVHSVMMVISAQIREGGVPSPRLSNWINDLPKVCDTVIPVMKVGCTVYHYFSTISAAAAPGITRPSLLSSPCESRIYRPSITVITPAWPFSFGQIGQEAALAQLSMGTLCMFV